MGNVPSNQFSIFSEKETSFMESNDEDNRSKNNENFQTNHSVINRQNSKENMCRENAVEGENSHGNKNLCTVEPVLKQSRSELSDLSERNRKNLEDFENELLKKQEKRREILATKKKEMEDLRNEVQILREENKNLKKENLEYQIFKEELQRLKEQNLHFKNNLNSTSDTEDLKLQNLQKENEKTNKELTKIKEENVYLKLLSSNSNSSEITTLQEENQNLKEQLKEKISALEKTSSLLDKNRELKISIVEMQTELQNLNKVSVDFEHEREEYKSHVVALKDIINVSKKMLLIREGQLRELRQKIETIEQTLSGQEMNLLSQDLRLEYERQLQSIRNLKTLYEERQRSDQREKEELRELLEDTKKELENEKKRNEESGERIQELEEQNSQKYDEIKCLESNLGLSKAECRQYQAELTVINQLFSEILLGFNTNQEIDLDRLTKHLEDHHGLLKEIVINEISPAASSALPKTLLDLLSQINEGKENKMSLENLEHSEEDLGQNRLETITEESESQLSSYNINSAEEIVELLPKVWRVLIELLSHQRTPTNVLTEEKQPDDENPCYKTVQTPKGPSLVLSVSQTFIRLKDLILEKKSLEKETGHLKQLNGHLESRLQDQEKRLEMVSSELNKTWHVVGKLQKQHQLLHTQEKILRYELAQKRKLLTTLREELEYSREKWQQAREKNSTTEKQWKQLRGEFAARRNIIRDDFSNSVESGYSDEKCSSSDDEIEKGYESDVSECIPTNTTIEKNTSNCPDKCDNHSIEDNACNRENTSIGSTTNDSDIKEENNAELANKDDKTVSKENTENISEPTDSSNISQTNHESGPSIEHTDNTIRQKKSVTELIHEELEQLLENEERLAQSLKNKEEKTDSDGAAHTSNSKSGKCSIVEEIWAVKNDILKAKDEDCLTEKNVLPNLTNVYEANLQLEKNIESLSHNIENPSTSTDNEKETSISTPKKTFDDLMAAKDARLKRLEGQCQQLVDKVTNTTNKRKVITNKLDGLHETYGEKSNSSKDIDKESLPDNEKGETSKKDQE